MWPSFRTTKSGKWVLAGEHAVLRGATAVALPHPDVALTLDFRTEDGPLVVQPEKIRPILGDVLESIEREVDGMGKSFARPRGTLVVESTIPLGAGLGSSAAFCVAIAEWLSAVYPLDARAQHDLARRLEDNFHGKSSGMDVAVVAEGRPIAFQMERGATPLQIKKLPRFTFHDTGVRSKTSHCVEKVGEFRDRHPVMGQRSDEAMGQAARRAMEGLVRFDTGDTKAGLELVAAAMKQAQECFDVWDLVPHEAGILLEKLSREGALAAKLTGAGGGGFIVALWP